MLLLALVATLAAVAPDGRAPRVTFVPHLVPMTRGILATCYFDLKGSLGELQDAYAEFYAGQPAVTVNHFGGGAAWYIGSRNERRFHDDFYGALIERLRLPRASSSAETMSPRSYASMRSLRSRAAIVSALAPVAAVAVADAVALAAASPRGSGNSDKSSSDPCDSATRLSIAFSSSRTLPGHE